MVEQEVKVIEENVDFGMRNAGLQRAVYFQRSDNNSMNNADVVLAASAAKNGAAQLSIMTKQQFNGKFLGLTQQFSISAGQREPELPYPLKVCKQLLEAQNNPVGVSRTEMMSDEAILVVPPNVSFDEAVRVVTPVVAQAYRMMDAAQQARVSEQQAAGEQQESQKITAMVQAALEKAGLGGDERGKRVIQELIPAIKEYAAEKRGQPLGAQLPQKKQGGPDLS